MGLGGPMPCPLFFKCILPNSSFNYKAGQPESKGADTKVVDFLPALKNESQAELECKLMDPNPKHDSLSMEPKNNNNTLQANISHKGWLWQVSSFWNTFLCVKKSIKGENTADTTTFRHRTCGGEFGFVLTACSFNIQHLHKLVSPAGRKKSFLEHTPQIKVIPSDNGVQFFTFMLNDQPKKKRERSLALYH